MIGMIGGSTPRTERIGNILFCDQLPYPTDYVRNGLQLVLFVPQDAAAIARARYAVGKLVEHGRLRESDTRLRMARDTYQFDTLVDDFLRGMMDAKAGEDGPEAPNLVVPVTP